MVVGWPIGSFLVRSVLIIWEPERCLPTVRGQAGVGFALGCSFRGLVVWVCRGLVWGLV